MDLYNDVSYDISKLVTNGYSTSFGSATKLFPISIRKHIYAIYGLVRIADEVVDTYRGKDVDKVLLDLETEVYTAMRRGYSTNPVIQSFAITAKVYGIDRSLIHPFFVSMAMDLHPAVYTQATYEKYIYGSAEVVGLMCLRVFCEGNDKLYGKLEKGAKALGAAYQKVNFLRDMAADYKELGRLYFPGVEFDSFDDAVKEKIIRNIEKDFIVAERSIHLLPENSNSAVFMSFVYYQALLAKLSKTPAATIKQKRIRINDVAKTALMTKVAIARRLKRAA